MRITRKLFNDVEILVVTGEYHVSVALDDVSQALDRNVDTLLTAAKNLGVAGDIYEVPQLPRGIVRMVLVPAAKQISDEIGTTDFSEWLEGVGITESDAADIAREAIDHARRT